MSSATGELCEHQLTQLLVHSRRKNQAHANIGLLLVSEGEILQVLEGEQLAIEQIYAVIARDIRHARLHKLADGLIAERTFPDWSMGFATATPEKFKQLAGYQPLGSTSFLPAAPRHLDSFFVEVLRDFATVHATNR